MWRAPRRSTSSTTRSGATERPPRRSPGCARRAARPGPARRRHRPPAVASGPSRTTSSRSSSTRTARPCWSASDASGAGDDALDLAAEGPAVGERRAGLAARLAPRGVGLQVRGLDPRRAERGAPSRPSGSSSGGRASTVVRRPWTLPATVLPRPACSPTAHPPATVGNGDERVSRRRVVSEPTVAEGHRRAHGLRAASLDAQPVPRRRRGRGAARQRPGRRRRPTPRGSCASRCSGTGGRGAPARRRRGRRVPCPWRAGPRAGR